MKKSAKLLALVLALALVLTAFTGCGGTGTSGSAATPASTSGSEPAAGPDISEEVTLFATSTLGRPKFMTQHQRVSSATYDTVCHAQNVTAL